MNRHYSDILTRIPEPPTWFDEQAVPRWGTFHPSRLSVYADEAVLLLIACQACQHRFMVAMMDSLMDRMQEYQAQVAVCVAKGMKPGKAGEQLTKRGHLAELIRTGAIHYGDPPNIKCCPSGSSMNSEPIMVLEYWTRPSTGGWIRNTKLEGHIEQPTANEHGTDE